MVIDFKPAAEDNVEAEHAFKVQLGGTLRDTGHRLQDQASLLSLDLLVHCDSFKVLVVLFQLHPASCVFTVLRHTSYVSS